MKRADHSFENIRWHRFKCLRSDEEYYTACMVSKFHSHRIVFALDVSLPPD